LSWTRRFGRRKRLPWSTNLVVAEVLVRLAKIQPGQRVMDPFCGTGTILQAVRRQYPTTHLLGLDHNPTTLTLATNNSHAPNNSLAPENSFAPGNSLAPKNSVATENSFATENSVAPGNSLAPKNSVATENSLAPGSSVVVENSVVVGGSLSFVRGVAEALPVASGSVDRVVANLPFGKQVGSHRANRTLYPAALGELARVLAADGRAVLLTEDKRLLESAIERQSGLKVVRQRLLRYNGATPTAYVLARTRLPRTARSR
jgi:ubiquinone/menaquinone biosynthesis C-methylase UbiE